jgi:hypothetical protein
MRAALNELHRKSTRGGTVISSGDEPVCVRLECKKSDLDWERCFHAMKQPITLNIVFQFQFLDDIDTLRCSGYLQKTAICQVYQCIRYCIRQGAHFERRGTETGSLTAEEGRVEDKEEGGFREVFLRGRATSCGRSLAR